jgi:hypothetical protein
VAAVRSIAALIERLREIEGGMPPQDGAKWFARLYLEVTIDLAAALDTGHGLEDPDFLERLALIYGNDVLGAFAAAGSGHGRVPAAWAPLFDARRDPRVAPLQFALAGLNAHTNNDVPIGLVKGCASAGIEPRTQSAQFRDYAAMTSMLQGTEARVKPWLLTGAVAELDRDFGNVDNAVAMWSLARAREAAWVRGEVLWALRGSGRLTGAYEEVLGRTVAFAGRGLLVPNP